MIVHIPDGATVVGDADVADDSDVFAGKAPIPGDTKEMGQVIRAKLAERSKVAASR